MANYKFNRNDDMSYLDLIAKANTGQILLGNWVLGTLVIYKVDGDEIFRNRCTLGTTYDNLPYCVAKLHIGVDVYVDPFMSTNDKTIYVIDKEDLNKFVITKESLISEFEIDKLMKDYDLENVSEFIEVLDEIEKRCDISFKLDFNLDDQLTKFKRLGIIKDDYISHIIDAALTECARFKKNSFLTSISEQYE